MNEPADRDDVIALLERTLASRASGTRASHDLAAQARSRRRHSVVLRSALAGAAAVGVAIAVIVPTVLAGSGSEPVTQSQATSQVSATPQPTAANGLPPAQAADDGWRWETYGGVELQVPVDWGNGQTNTQWCGGEGGAPYVGRPVGIVTFQLCSQAEQVPPENEQRYVWFAADGPAGRATFDGGWVRETRLVGEAFVSVQLDDATVADRILSSARVVADVDAAGCPVDYAVTRSLDARPTAGALDPTQVTSDGVACQYTVPGNGPIQPALIASHRLTAEQVRAFADAVVVAPVGGGPDNPDECSTESRRGTAALLVRLATTDGTRDVIVWYAGCINGADDGVSLHALTAGVLAPVFGGGVIPQTVNGAVTPLLTAAGRF